MTVNFKSLTRALKRGHNKQDVKHMPDGNLKVQIYRRAPKQKWVLM